MAVPTNRSRISEILGTDTKPKVPSTPETGSRVAQILGVGTPDAARQAIYKPAIGPTTYDWVEEGYIDSATPAWQKALASGPVGGFFNIIQKPLALGSSLAKESIDLVTGQGFNFGDLRKQYNENYTFGRLLHDYDLMQNRDSGWQKFGAAALGFTGDVLLDPLSYIGLVGKGAAFTAKLAGGGARSLGRKAIAENLRKVTLGHITRTAGDDVARGLGDNVFMELGDRLARGEAGRFGQVQLRKGRSGGWELDVFAKVGDDAAEVVTSTVKIGKSVADDVTDFYNISSKAMQKGASFIDGDELRRAANFVARSEIDKAGRSSADNVAAAVERNVNRAVRELGEDTTEDAIREAIERATREATEEASLGHKAFLTADEAAGMKIGIGMKVPGTGPIGRALRIADPIERAINKVTRAGVQAPVGIRFMTSETPIIGKLAMGLPRGVRGAVNRAGLSKAGQALVGGRLQDLKRTLRSTDDVVLIQQGKRLIHSVARGNSKGKYAKTQMLQRVRLITEAIEDAGADPAMVYHAVGGDEAAAAQLAVLDDSLLNTVQEGIEELRVMANQMGGSEFLSSVDNYVPRQLTDEAREALQEALGASGRYSQRTHRGRGAYQPTGPELRRSYLSRQDFDKAAEAKAAADGISVEEAASKLKQSGEATDEFFGETLLAPGTVDELTGEVAGSVEKQIADIIERNGGDYALFVDDINMALRGWVDQVAPRVGETYTQTLLTESGILQHRFVEYVRLPSEAARAASAKLLKAEEKFAARQADVIRAAYEVQSAVGAKLETARLTLRRSEELADEAQHLLDVARREEDELFQKKSVEEQRVLGLEERQKEIQDILDQVEGNIPGAEGEQLVALEKQRQGLLNDLNAIRGDQGRFRWAYETIASGTAQKLWLEKAIREVFTSGENFDAFAREMAQVDVSDPSFDPTGIFVAPDGTQIVVQDAIGLVDGILDQADTQGVGLWMGVERDIDLINLEVAANNPINKVSYMRNRINQELEEALNVANSYREATGEDILLPTPENALEAQMAIREVVDEAIEAEMPTVGKSVSVMMDGMEPELAVYYAVNDFPSIGPSASSEADWAAITTQIEEKIGGRIQDLGDEIAARGEPLNLSYVDKSGDEQILTVADYVLLKQKLNAIEVARNSHQIPLRQVRPGIDDLRQVAGPSGSNPGGEYVDASGKRYYVKQYNEVVDTGGMEPTPRLGENGAPIPSPRRAAGEVLANAFYRELGLGAPNSYMSYGADGTVNHIAPMLDDFQTVMSTGMSPNQLFTWTDPNTGLRQVGDVVPSDASDVLSFQEQAAQGFTADVILANWDAAGTGFDNIGLAPWHLTETAVVRIDNGGSFGFRAQGLPKEDVGWNYLEVSDLETLADAGMNPWAAGLTGDVDAGQVSQQLDMILSLRARYGGFPNFVRRHAGDMSDADIAYFADFLEARTRVMSERFQKPFYELGTEEFEKAGLASRGFNEKVIEDAFTERSLGPEQPVVYSDKQQTAQQLGLKSWLSPNESTQAVKGVLPEDADALITEVFRDDLGISANSNRVEPALEASQVLFNSGFVDGIGDPIPWERFEDFFNLLEADGWADVLDPDDAWGEIFEDFAGIVDGNDLPDDIKIGVILIDPKTSDAGFAPEIVMSMPADDPILGTPPGVLWEFPVSQVPKAEGGQATPLNVFKKIIKDQLGTDGMPVGTINQRFGDTYYMVGVNTGSIENLSMAPTAAPLAPFTPEGVTSSMVATGQVPDAVTRLNHTTSSGGVKNVWGRYGDIDDITWGDYLAINATPGNIKFGGWGNTVYNLELNVPLGGESIKIYGLAEKEARLAAELAIQMGVETDPTKLSSISQRLTELTESGKKARQSAVTSSDELIFDQVGRVLDDDPEFFNQFIETLNKLDEWGKTGAITGAKEDVLEPIEIAQRIKAFDPVSVRPEYQEVAQKLKNLKGHELINFAVLLRSRHGRKFHQAVDLGIDADTLTAFLGNPEEFLDAALKLFNDIDPNLNPDVWDGKGIERRLVGGASYEKLKHKDASMSFGRGWINVVGGRTIKPRSGQYGSVTGTALEFAEAAVDAADIKRVAGRMYMDFLEKFKTSLSVDGYHTIAWMNREGVTDMVSKMPVTFDKKNYSWWPNYMVTDPLAINYKGGSHGAGYPFDPDFELTSDFVGASQFLEDMDRNVVDAFPAAKVVEDLPEGDALEQLVMERSQVVSDLELAKGDFNQAKTSFEYALDQREAAAEIAEQRVATAAQNRILVGELDAAQRQIDAAVDTLNTLGIGDGVSLYDIPSDDLIDLKIATNILIEADGQRIRMALDEMEDGAEGWFDLLSSTAEQRTEIHRIGGREAVLEAAFSTGMKPIGAIAQGPPNIVESMVAAERFVARGGAKAFFRKYDKLHNLLRAYMIAKPGFHGRNFMSGVFMNHLAGMNWSSYRRFMRAYWKFQEEEAVRLGMPDRASKMRKAMRARGINPNNVSAEHVDYVRELAETGSLGAAGAQVASEFVDTAGPGVGKTTVKIGGKKINLATAMNPASSQNLPLRLSRNFGMATETFLRGSLGFDTLLKGNSADEAFDNVMKFHFDYDDLSDFERNVVKKVVPFYTWTRKNMPLMFEMAARRPAVFNKYTSLKKEMEYGQERPKVIPEWMQRQGAIQTPFTYDGENMFILPDMPFKAPMELIEPSLRFDRDESAMDRIQTALASFGTQITPLIKAPYEWKAKQNLWKGYNFDGKYQVVPRAYAKVPFLMDMLSLPGIAAKNSKGQWAMKDYELHAMAQLLPTLSDLRRLFPDEERYQKRAVSTWISFMFGAGLRTNTKWEQDRELQSRMYEMRDEMKQERSLAGATL